MVVISLSGASSGFFSFISPGNGKS